MDDRGIMVSFSVVCHADNVSRVRNLLIDLGMTSIVASGSEIHGVCEMEELQEVMRVLKNKGVGFGHETEIITRPYSSTKHSRLN
jgi:hypothetical protein